MEKQRLSPKGGAGGDQAFRGGAEARIRGLRCRVGQTVGEVASENLPLGIRHMAGSALTSYQSSQSPQTSSGLIPSGQMEAEAAGEQTCSESAVNELENWC